MRARTSAALAPQPTKPTLSPGAYILISFPLGLLYFVFVVLGLAFSIALVPVFVGLPMLVGVLAAAGGIAGFERTLARSVLGRAEADAVPIRPAGEERFFRRLAAALADPASYLNVALCLLKFPIGLVNFAVAAAFICASLGLIATPAVYLALRRTIGIDIFASTEWLANLAPELTSLQLAFVFSALGFVLLLISLSLIRFIASFTAELMLTITRFSFGRVPLEPTGAGNPPMRATAARQDEPPARGPLGVGAEEPVMREPMSEPVQEPTNETVREFTRESVPGPAREPVFEMPGPAQKPFAQEELQEELQEERVEEQKAAAAGASNKLR